ncbi:MAG: DUF5054 domain-containing protein, partial [Devosia sp.]
AEHTWGVDIKSYLRDEKTWDRLSLETARQTDYRFIYTEASWAEQRGYLDAAVKELDTTDKAAARKALAALRVPAEAKLEATGGTTEQAEIDGWQIGTDPKTGDITALAAPDGTTLTGYDGTLLGYRHESYSAADQTRYRESYITHPFDWALRDFDKPGLDTANTARSASWSPALAGTTRQRRALTLKLELPNETHSELGAPRSAEIRLSPLDDTRLEVAIILYDKPANRIPEAGFLLVTPAEASGWEYHKMGLWQPGDRVAPNAGGGLQAVAAVRAKLPAKKALTITPLDTPLVAPAAGDFMTYSPAPPDLSRGLRFNLYNNKWGTNFPMWWEGDLKARFVLELAKT